VKYLSLISGFYHSIWRFVAHFKNLSLNLEICRSFQEFIAQSGDLSLKRVSLPSYLVETPRSQKRAMQRLAEWLLSKGF